MALGRRCAAGCATWPDSPRFARCPECGEETRRYHSVEPLTDEEAAHRYFEAFYAEWDENLPSQRLAMTPEESLRWDSLYPNGRPDRPVHEAR